MPPLILHFPDSACFTLTIATLRRCHWPPLQAGLIVPNERNLLSAHSILDARRRQQGASDFSSRTGPAAGRGRGPNSSMRPAWAKGRGSGSGGADSGFLLAVEWEALCIVARIADAFELKGAGSALQEVLEVQQSADAAGAGAAAAVVAGGLFAGGGGGSGGGKTGKLATAALSKLRSHAAYNDLVERLKVRGRLGSVYMARPSRAGCKVLLLMQMS